MREISRLQVIDVVMMSWPWATKHPASSRRQRFITTLIIGIQLLSNMRVTIALILAAAAIPARAATCESLAQLSLQNTTVTAAQSVAAGAFTQGKQNDAFRALPAFCRVAATVRPVADSEIKIEVWMPSSGWNGKFRGTGNGGLGGSMNFNGIAAAMRGGYAVAGNNTGHDGGASLMMGHPEKIRDFGERAGHEMTVKAKIGRAHV